MNFIYKFLANYIIGIFKRFWKNFKVAEKKQIAQKKEEEAKDAKEKSDKAYNDFKSMYDAYKSQQRDED